MHMNESHVCSVWTHTYIIQTHINVTVRRVCVYTHVWVNVQIDLARERKHTYGPNLKIGILKIFQSVHLITTSF